MPTTELLGEGEEGEVERTKGEQEEHGGSLEVLVNRLLG